MNQPVSAGSTIRLKHLSDATWQTAQVASVKDGYFHLNLQDGHSIQQNGRTAGQSLQLCRDSQGRWHSLSGDEYELMMPGEADGERQGASAMRQTASA